MLILCHFIFLRTAVEPSLFRSLTGKPEVGRPERFIALLTNSSTNGALAAITIAPSSIFH